MLNVPIAEAGKAWWQLMKAACVLSTCRVLFWVPHFTSWTAGLWRCVHSRQDLSIDSAIASSALGALDLREGKAGLWAGHRRGSGMYSSKVVCLQTMFLMFLI